MEIDAHTLLDSSGIDLKWPWPLGGDSPPRIFVRVPCHARSNPTKPDARLLLCLPFIPSPEFSGTHFDLGSFWIVPWIKDYVEYEDIPEPVFGFWTKLYRRPRPRCGGERVVVRQNSGIAIYRDTVVSRVTQLRYAFNLDYECLGYFFCQVQDEVFNGPLSESDVIIPLRLGHTQRLLWRWDRTTGHSFVTDLRDRALCEAFRFAFGNEVREALHEFADLYRLAEEWSWEVVHAFAEVGDAVTKSRVELQSTSIEIPARLDLLRARLESCPDWMLLGRLSHLAELIGKYIPCIEGELLRATGQLPPLSPTPADDDPPAITDARHSLDFASVNWYGTPHTFTANQAACVRVLWEAWKNQTPVLGGLTIIEAAGVDREDERLDLVFRDHLAWGTMIVSPLKGRYCLKAPDAAT
jgi:hypothetical protein